MFNTVLLTGENEYSRDYSTAPVKNFLKEKSVLKPAMKFKTQVEESRRVFGHENFRFSDGKVFLTRSNDIYWLEHVKENRDIVLPKDPKFLDWVTLYHEQHTIALHLTSNNKRGDIKIYGEGSRIMGYDEPLVCDMDFLSLKFIYVNDIEGWVIT